MRLPQDIANLLAVAVRDVIWFKTSVCAFLEECGVPRSIMLEVRRMKGHTPTVKIVHHVLDRLAEQGDEGYDVARRMLTKMHYWKDMHTVPPDRRDVAIASLRALQAGYKRYEDQLRYQQEQRERQMQAERVERSRVSDLDHEKLQSFRDEFDVVHSIADPSERGNRLQDLMNRIFAYYCEESKGGFQRRGEQVDGLFYFDKHWHYVEIRWRKEKATAADVSVLRDRAKSAFGGDTKALFISFNGFSQDCLDGLAGTRDERVTLMDGFDLRCVLDCQIALDVLLAEKQARLVQLGRPFVSAKEIMAERVRRDG
jgi:hypothetical protein